MELVDEVSIELVEVVVVVVDIVVVVVVRVTVTVVVLGWRVMVVVTVATQEVTSAAGRMAKWGESSWGEAAAAGWSWWCWALAGFFASC